MTVLSLAVSSKTLVSSFELHHMTNVSLDHSSFRIYVGNLNHERVSCIIHVISTINSLLSNYTDNFFWSEIVLLKIRHVSSLFVPYQALCKKPFDWFSGYASFTFRFKPSKFYFCFETPRSNLDNYIHATNVIAKFDYKFQYRTRRYDTNYGECSSLSACEKRYRESWNLHKPKLPNISEFSKKEL